MLRFWTLLGIFALFSDAIEAQLMEPFRIEPGPSVNATRGEPWPQPYRIIEGYGFRLLRPSVFRMLVTGETCDILEDAVQRYTRIVMTEARAAVRLLGSRRRRHARRDPLFAGDIVALEIRLINPCENLPHLGMNESYILDVPEDSDTGTLVSNSIWGILRGLETFTHILTASGDGPNLAVKCRTVIDEPLFPHRGLLLDTSRHYLPVLDILLTLDGMSYNKMNVLHWHIVDDNSFPYQSIRFPELSAKGAYHPSMVYTPDDVTKVIEYARLRGIRVVPEFDTPGHTRSWGQSHPELLTTCYDTSTGEPDGTLGPLDPTAAKLYPFLRELFAEIVAAFPDRYIHLGGDEVPFDCWASNPNIRDYMRRRGMNDTYQLLEEEYVEGLLNITETLGASPVVWQEVFDNGVKLNPETVVHVWTGNQMTKLASVTKAGFHALLSTCWYLDHIAGGGDWLKFYSCDPLAFPSTSEQRRLVLGGEACMWGESVDRTNVHPRIWPRASAAAERLWSHDRSPSISYAARRLEEHTCRMNRRGIPAQPPNGPGFCVL
ncbi:beta-hexosaminidase subunit alpha-like [Athalia rosae]|uniref:beta-hexosaminidase subunit alpha-like n=1 Tax=Athalia rosae TaxID=37344 RepID=UPI0020331C7A|nr:beta-hexosaminidase subunit alpha-like [Athalia rosae]